MADFRGYEMALAEAEARLAAMTDRLTRERDEARAEVARLTAMLRYAIDHQGAQP